jgi:hypothetical protein
MDLVKVHFKLDSADWHGCPSETLWAKPLMGIGAPTAFELENSPFYCKGVSYRDVISVVKRDNQYEFSAVIARGGHSTYRLVVEGENDAFRMCWQKLQNLGCTYEGGDFNGKKLFAVDVPATADIYAVYPILEEGEKESVWIFEEGHVGHPLRDKPQNEVSH